MGIRFYHFILFLHLLPVLCGLQQARNTFCLQGATSGGSLREELAREMIDDRKNEKTKKKRAFLENVRHHQSCQSSNHLHDCPWHYQATQCKMLQGCALFPPCWVGSELATFILWGTPNKYWNWWRVSQSRPVVQNGQNTVDTVVQVLVGNLR